MPYKNKEKLIAQGKKYYQKNRDKILAISRTDSYKERRRKQQNKLRDSNLEKFRIKERETYARKSHQIKANIKARHAEYRTRKLQRTPKWADLEAIKQKYLTCPEGYHVDHVIPLCGKEVSGLHVANNLDHLPAIDNLKKSNKFL